MFKGAEIKDISKFAGKINEFKEKEGLVTIGNIELGKQPLFLAPMEDITDPSFRFVCKHFGVDVMYTEFISSDGLIRNARKSLEKLTIYDYERPMGIQLYGHLIGPMVESAKIAETRNPEFIDINFGCPVKKISRRGAGAGMLCNISLMIEMTEAIVKAVKIPVTVKTRLGWDEENKNIIEIAERLQDVGIKALTIHGRTKAQLYKGIADWTLIGEVKNNPRIHIPIIGNGDIVSPDSAKEAFEKFGVDGIMIGRGAVGAPWIFRDIKTFLQTGKYANPLTIAEKIELAKLHFNKSIELKGERVGVYEMRRHFSNYFKGLKNFKETRLKLLTEKDPELIYEQLDEIKEKWGKLKFPV
ncbi:tRNA-dihydrouridine synthase B [subsurface metagenome]